MAKKIVSKAPSQDNDNRSYMGGAYLNRMVNKLSAVQLNKWESHDYSMGRARTKYIYVGFRVYRPHRQPILP